MVLALVLANDIILKETINPTKMSEEINDVTEQVEAVEQAPEATETNEDAPQDEESV